LKQLGRKFIFKSFLTFILFGCGVQGVSAQEEYDYSELINFGYQWNLGVFFHSDWGKSFFNVPSNFSNAMQVDKLGGTSQNGGVILRYGDLFDFYIGMAFRRRNQTISYTAPYFESDQHWVEEESKVRYFGAYLQMNLKLHKHFWMGVNGKYLPINSYDVNYTIRHVDGYVVDQKANRQESPLTNEYNKYYSIGIQVASPVRVTPNVMLIPEMGYEYGLAPLFNTGSGQVLSNGHIEGADFSDANIYAGFKFIVYFEYMESLSRGR